MMGRQALSKIADATRYIVTGSAFRLDSRNQRHVYLDIDDGNMQKTLRQFLILFQSPEYRIYLRARFNRRLLANARLLRWHKNVKLIWRSPGQARPLVLVTDRSTRATAHDGRHDRKLIHIVYDYSPNLKLGSSDLVMPESMHHQLYCQYGEHQRLGGYQMSKRKMRIFFAGEWDSAQYDNPIMIDPFHLESRYRVVRFLQSSGLATVVKGDDELSSLLEGGYYNGLVMADARMRIHQEKWLAALSQSDFFVCPPGLLVPLSHNAVEAMAVGTIPLINYPQWFHPHLSDGLNCIAFSTLNDLKQKILAILRMPQSGIDLLRCNTIAYYSQYLDVDKAARRLLEQPSGQVRLHMWEENAAALRRTMSAKNQ